MGRLRKLRKRLRKLLKRALKSRLKVVKTKTLLRPGKTFRLSAKCSSRMKQSPSKPRKKLSVKSLKNSTRRKRLPARRPLRRSSLLSSNSRMLALGSRKVGPPNQTNLGLGGSALPTRAPRRILKQPPWRCNSILVVLLRALLKCFPSIPQGSTTCPSSQPRTSTCRPWTMTGRATSSLWETTASSRPSRSVSLLIYKLYMACMARREANENEEAMLAQAIELSQDPQVHEVVVGQRIVSVPVQQAG